MTLTTEQLNSSNEKMCGGDSVETIEKNPKSWAAWKREAERLQAIIDANREAQPLNGWRVTVNRTGDRHGVASISGPGVFCMEVPVEFSMLDFMESLAAPPAPAVPDEIDSFADQVIGTKNKIIRLPAPLYVPHEGISVYLDADTLLSCIEQQGFLVLLDSI